MLVILTYLRFSNNTIVSACCCRFRVVCSPNEIDRTRRGYNCCPLTVIDSALLFTHHHHLT